MSAPVVILNHPQMGENIGAAARAMLNFGLTDLRLVAPRDGWPNQRADDMAAGALQKMPPVKVFATLAEALSDLHFIFATTARPRDMVKPVFTPHGAASESVRRVAEGQNIGFVFGAERAGLDNDDVALCQAILTVPTPPEFSSLNLGQSVLLIAYEWFTAQDDTPPTAMAETPAQHEKLLEMFERLEAELESGGFFRSEGLKPMMARNLRNMLGRAQMTDQEVRTFHGVITALTNKK